MSRKPARKTLKNKADRLFSLVIRGRDGCCQGCGQGWGLQCAHIFSRSYHAVRWDEENAVTLCAGCHIKYTHKPIEWTDWAIAYLGEAKYQALRERATTMARQDYQEVVERLEDRIDELEIA